MVRGPLCRPGSSPNAFLKTELVLEENLLDCNHKSSLQVLFNSLRRPSLEEKHLLWASFSCKKDGSDSSELVQNESDGESSSGLERSSDYSESTSECIKLRRRSDQHLEIETDSSPSKTDQGISNCADYQVGIPFPSPPDVPRVKSVSPKELKAVRKTPTKEGTPQSMTEERESPASRPPTPPTEPRMSQAPRYRRRFMMASEISRTPSCDEVGHEPKAQKVAPVLTARHLRPMHKEEDELSETWKRFEQRKLKRKERSRSKNRMNERSSTAIGLLCWSDHARRLCGQMASKLAQPAEAFSHRTPSFNEGSRFVPQVESTAFRMWA